MKGLLRRAVLLCLVVAGCGLGPVGRGAAGPDVATGVAASGGTPFADAALGLRLLGTRDPQKPTVIFVNGAGGSAAQFEVLADSLAERANTLVFSYGADDRLPSSADLLRRQLANLRGPVVIVAHSMGTLLPAYVGATTSRDETGCIGAVYLNPLIGGSRYADDIPALRWLRPFKPLVQRVFFPPWVRDLVPESDFQQAIFGPSSRTSSFADRAVLLFTEKPGDEPDILPSRVVRAFGTTRSALVAQLGQVAGVDSPLGHNAPLRHPEIVVPLVDAVMEPLETTPRCAAERPDTAGTDGGPAHAADRRATG